MTKRKNPFVRVKQTYYEDGGDVHWWVDEDELEEFKSNFCEESDEENMPKATATREISGRDWNKFIIEQCTFDDHQGDFVDEDCPQCEHFLVHINNSPEDTRICSNFDCEYENDSLKKYYAEEEAEILEAKNSPPKPKFRVVDQTLEQFCKQHGFKFDDRITKMTCIVCKKLIPNPDFFLQDGYAIINYDHEDCENNGPTIATPVSKKKIDEWAKLL